MQTFGMIITHHGGQCFKVTFGDLTLVFDPVSKASKLPAVRFGADIALVSRDHPDANGWDEASYGDKKPFAITGPGEYERQGVVIRGFQSKGEGCLLNTIYSAELEGMTLVHLGALADPALSQDARENLDDIDVLFVPVGGDGTLPTAKAHELAVSLEPRIIVPMRWNGSSEEGSLQSFLKEAGNGSSETDKLTLKKKDLATYNGSILVIKP